MRIQLDFSRFGRVLSVLAVAACLLPAGGLQAQTKPADPEAVRNASRAAAAKFLDRSRPQAERLAALRDLGYPDDRTAAALLGLGLDRTQSDTIRWEALQRVPYGDGYRETVLKILSDPGDGGEELDANLIADLSRRTAVTPPARIRQQIQSVWRKLLDDRRDKVRLQAYRALVSNHDSVALGLLVESLREGRGVPVPLPEAIDLLDQDGAVNYIGTLRPYLHHEDPSVQAKAARALAGDPESRPAIVELAKNPSTPGEVRLNALRALAREDDQFASYALPLMENGGEDPGIRLAAMKDFVGRMNYNRVAPADQVRFARAVEKLAGEKDLGTDESVKVKSAAQELHAYLLQAFPEVRKSYEKP
ncbi:MAG: Lipoprotein amino terminal region [Acidobacteriota bacterium]|jgi:hypothetical protein|nr:Lipoprotein amino terminal region [Acidobacteriota bacterium]